MTKIIAPTGRVVVKLDAAETTHANGLIIPENAQVRNDHAIVVSSGIEGVEVGDRILLSGPYAGARFDIDGVEYNSVVPEEILAVLG